MHRKINETTPKQINEKIKYKKSSKIIEIKFQLLKNKNKIKSTIKNLKNQHKI